MRGRKKFERMRLPRCIRFGVLDPFVGVVLWRSEDKSVAAVAAKRDYRTGRRDVFLIDLSLGEEVDK